MSDYKEIAQAINNYINCLKVLTENKILLNKKDFTGQLGEWLVETVFEGERAPSGIQAGWDVKTKDKFIQVKSHAKAINNKARFSAVDKDTLVKVDELIIVVFTHDYKLKEFYQVPWEIVVEKTKLRGQKTKRNEINWNDILEYRKELNALPNQEIINMFKIN